MTTKNESASRIFKELASLMLAETKKKSPKDILKFYCVLLSAVMAPMVVAFGHKHVASVLRNMAESFDNFGNN